MLLSAEGIFGCNLVHPMHSTLRTEGRQALGDITLCLVQFSLFPDSPLATNCGFA